MSFSNFEIVTTLTIGTIGAILLLYVIVLKKKGWLTDEPSPGTSYLCPNPECRKIFEKPVKLTDLSTWPARSYLACPHCGLNLGTISPGKTNSSKRDEGIFSGNQSQTALKDPTLMMENKSDVNLHLRAAKTSVGPKPILEDEPFIIAREQPVASPQSEPPVRAPSKPIESSMIRGSNKQQSETSRNCSHYFGYVKTLPKSTPIPDECMWCPQIVKCLTGTEKIEA
jgi:hypothetical protein